MKTELKQEWMKRLKSGIYEQGKRVLRNRDNKYCCLGVLCDIINPDGWKKGDPTTLYFNGENYNGLNEDTRIKVGITLDDHDKLIEMNDDFSDSFDKIADWIQDNIKED